MKSTQWIVHKFGGTSVGSAERYKNVGKILKREEKTQNPPRGPRGMKNAVVVSAMSGVTNSLIELVELAKNQNSSYPKALHDLKSKHFQTIDELLPQAYRSALKTQFEADFSDLNDVLRGVYLSRSASSSILDFISGHGEIWSAQLLNAYLRSQGMDSQWLDARLALVVCPSQSGLTIQWETSRSHLKKWLKKNSQTYLIITGYIASTSDGIPATLGRNGSDYSATLFGNLLHALKITIWTDVDGVLSADPKQVPDAVVLDEMSYSEATELAYFGAKVVHPSTMMPAIAKKVPIWIRNTLNPEHPGTLIHHSPQPSLQPVKGFSTIDSIALVNVEGTGMIGVPGIAERLFQALRENGISIILISQASSEHSICFAIQQKQAENIRKIIETAFFSELHHGKIQEIKVTPHCSILAAVGDNMVKTPAVAGRFLSALGRARINIIAIAQGSSERNISVVIDSKDSKRAIRVVHSSFYLSNQTLSIGVIGLGNIGSTFLNQLKKEQARLKTEFHIDLRVRGIANSSQMFLSDEIRLDSWESQFQKKTSPCNLNEFVSHVHTDYLPHTVIIDCTASSQIPSLYPTWIKQGIHLITPNKKANSGPLDSYRALRDLAKTKNRFFLYETNVGAGLPILKTLRDLIDTGDQIEQIQGILSGTLSFLFNEFTPNFAQNQSFSQLVQIAKAKGYTEPNPKEDLSGTDVGRKLVILAREMGLPLELKEIKIEDLSQYDDQTMKRKLESAEKNREVLRYVGTIEKNGKASVGIRKYPLNHPFARLSGSDNCVMFKTTRYFHQPLMVQGPGAGPEVTAAGVFADLLRLSSFLGAP